VAADSSDWRMEFKVKLLLDRDFVMRRLIVTQSDMTIGEQNLALG
jgi:hypothetical protein